MWTPVLTSSPTQYEKDINKLKATEMIRGLVVYRGSVRDEAEAPQFAEARDKRRNLADVYCYEKTIYRAVDREKAGGNGHKSP